MKCYIGNGVVVDPAHLLQEIQRLEAPGVDVRSRLFVSESRPLILPFHAETSTARARVRERRRRQDRHHRQRASARPTRTRWPARPARVGT